ncbi:MAG: DMT family transporter [Halobacteriaceae archaeon]
MKTFTVSSEEPPVPPLFALGVAVIAVSTSAILIRLSDAPEPVQASYRVLFTVVLLVPFGLRRRHEFRHINRADWLSAMLAGLLLAAHFAAWFESVDRTTVAASVTLVSMQPAFVAIGAWLLLNERITRRMTWGIIIALMGALLMGMEGLISPPNTPTPEPLLGNVLAFLGAIFAAGYVLAGRSIRQRVSLSPYVLIVYAICALSLFGYTLGLGHSIVHYPLHEWILFLGMALGPGLLGHTVLNWSLRYVESSIVSVSLVGEPVGSALLAFLIFTEVPGPLTILGGSIAIVGILLTSTRG